LIVARVFPQGDVQIRGEVIETWRVVKPISEIDDAYLVDGTRIPVTLEDFFVILFNIAVENVQVDMVLLDYNGNLFVPDFSEQGSSLNVDSNKTFEIAGSIQEGVIMT
jgi:hypothetical protein